MKITKYEHACIVVEVNGQTLIIDPGEYTNDLVVPEGVVAVVITHSHADHVAARHLNEITTLNPEAIIYGHKDAVADITGNVQAVVANEGIRVGAFELEFYGGDHAVIDPSIPVIANLGVMVNDTLYYPGDSFTQPGRQVNILALPVSAPWMKISEAVAFAKAVAPGAVFPTHDAILSDTGKQLADRLIPALLENTTIQYQRLVEPLETMKT